MPQQAYRANLSSATYPMTIADGGRTVIIPGPDNNYDRRVDPTGQQLDAGIPQALYLENVMPTANGYQSVGYLAPEFGMTIPAGATHILQCIEVKAFTPAGLYTRSFSPTPLFIWNNGAFTCGIFGTRTVTFIGTPINPANPNGVYSSANVAGDIFLYYSSATQQELYTVGLDGPGNMTLINITATVTPLGFFTGEAISTICSSNNYLIANNYKTVYWSSTTTPTDFVSSLVSGAGQIDPNNSDSAIFYVKETSNGFYVYASSNILYAQYTGNARYPFKFTVVLKSNGPYAVNPCLSFGSADTGGHYVIEKNKNLKYIQANNSSSISAEVSDFLGKNPEQELFNSTLNTFTAQIAATGLPTIYLYMNRYILVSVNGTNDVGAASEKYTHVIVFDMDTNRYGRLKLDHSFLFTGYASKELVGFVNKQNNTIKFLTFDIYQTDFPAANLTFQPMQGVLLLGKFQYARSRFLKMEEIEVEGPQNTAIVPTPNFSCHLIPSLDGRNLGAAVPLTSSYLSGGVAKYPCHNTAQNHCVLLKGAFNVNTLQLKFTPAGDR